MRIASFAIVNFINVACSAVWYHLDMCQSAEAMSSKLIASVISRDRPLAMNEVSMKCRVHASFGKPLCTKALVIAPLTSDVRIAANNK